MTDHTFANVSNGPLDDGELLAQYGEPEYMLANDSNPEEIAYPNGWTVPAGGRAAPSVFDEEPGLFMPREVRKTSDVSPGWTCRTILCPNLTNGGNPALVIGPNPHRKRLVLLPELNNPNDVYISASNTGSAVSGGSPAMALGSTMGFLEMTHTGAVFAFCMAGGSQLLYFFEESFC